MKRSVVISVTIALVAATIVILLHATGLLQRFELAVAGYFSNPQTATRLVGEKWQYILVLLSSLGLAWMTLMTAHRARVAWLALVLLVEFAGLSWVCSLYHTFFQPLPS